VAKKVLFLDCDGVLNSRESFEREVAAGNPQLSHLDAAMIRRLQRVLEETGAVVVLSSTWRLVPDFVQAVIDAGIPIYDCTPQLGMNNHRGDEITAWLDAHISDDVKVIAIVDDDADAGDGPSLQARFVQTSFETGLQDEHERALIALLGPR
jgi:hypothetical protein